MPVVALFLPLEVAVAVTALVHLANNALKLLLVGSHTDLFVFTRFGLPAILAAFAGALLLGWLSTMPVLYSYSTLGRDMSVSVLSFVIGLLIIGFAVMELSEGLSRLRLSKRWLPLGGILSGFLGGLSGHQGAFRSVFLLGAGLDKTSFIATGVSIAIVVDLTRLLVYGIDFSDTFEAGVWSMAALATCSAFVGTLIARQLFEKATLHTVRSAVACLLLLIGTGMLSGLIG